MDRTRLSTGNDWRVLANRVGDDQRLLATLSRFHETFGRPGYRRHPSSACLPQRGASIRHGCTTLALTSGDVEQRGTEDLFQPLERAPRAHAGDYLLSKCRSTRADIWF
jgi:hypothetical protein